MGKRILVLTGSPRKGGNSEKLADAFIQGAKAGGHTVQKFQAAMTTIHGCTACDRCWSKDAACVFKDGFSELESMLETADVIVLATPLYWSTVPSQLKAAIDKLYAYVSDSCKRPLSIKESVLLACGECEGAQIFNGLIETYKGIAQFFKWEDRGVVAVPEVFHIGEIEKTEGLIKAEQLGRSM